MFKYKNKTTIFLSIKPLKINTERITMIKFYTHPYNYNLIHDLAKYHRKIYRKFEEKPNFLLLYYTEISIEQISLS
jgi:hypothetical protein